MSRPIVTIIGSENKSANDLLKHILGGVEELPESTSIIPENEEFKGYAWKIETKYYTADIILLPLSKVEKIPEEISNVVEAVIFYCDNTDLACIELVEDLMKKLDLCDPEVLLLVCDKLPEENAKKVIGFSRNRIMKWCTKNKFEAIELQFDDDDKEDCCIIKEKRGIARVIEALETHTWFNMAVKDIPNKPLNLPDNEHIEKLFDNILSEEGSDDFTDLLAQLNTIKESVQSLSINERRAGAEQVVAAFWRAIGGDEDEIAGLGEL